MSSPFVWGGRRESMGPLDLHPSRERIALGPDTPYGSAHCVLVAGRLRGQSLYGRRQTGQGWRASLCPDGANDAEISNKRKHT